MLVIGDDPEGDSTPFVYGARFPVLRTVELPAHPYDVPPGTAQQEYFDKLRLTSSD